MSLVLWGIYEETGQIPYKSVEHIKRKTSHVLQALTLQEVKIWGKVEEDPGFPEKRAVVLKFR